MKINIRTKGHYDFVNLTGKISEVVTKSGIKQGVVVLFVPSSTAALTTMEYEEGIIKDLISLFESWAPEKADYEHHQRWGDHNGAAHMKSALLGPDITIPIANGALQLGRWQQIVLIDFDERAREREVIISIVASKQ